MLPRTVVLTLSILVVAAATAVLPVAASAAVKPTVSLNESAGNAAGSAGSLGFSVSFNQTTGDAVKDVLIDLPSGLLINEETDGGACLTASGPVPGCQIGSGVAVIAGVSTPMSLYLVKPPAAANLAGVELVAGTLSVVGSLSFAPATNLADEPSLYYIHEIQFNDLPASPIDSLSFTLTGLTLPSSCLPGIVSLWANSQRAPLSRHASAPYTVSACAALPYAPSATEKITRNKYSIGATLVVNVVDPVGDSPSEEVSFQVPADLGLNTNMEPCLNGKSCTVGTVTATSPIIPSSQLHGTMTLSGTEHKPMLGISFPPPLGMTFSNSVSPVRFDLVSLPDLPLSRLTLNFTGNSLGRLFVSQCFAVTPSVTFTPFSGTTPLEVNALVTQAGCESKVTKSNPIAFASMSGLIADTPRLTIDATKGRLSPGIKSLTIKPPVGLSLLASALAGHSRQALSMKGAKLASARVRDGALVVTFKRTTAKVKVVLGAPLLVESPALLEQAHAHHARYRHLTVRITDGRGLRTRRPLTAHATS
jgi:hypothetical protein